MKRLLLQSKKEFLCPDGENILIEYKSVPNQSLCDWLKKHYNITLLKETHITGSDVVLATVVAEKDLFLGDRLSFSKTINRLTEEPAVVAYLQSIRESTKVQLQYGLIDDSLVSIEKIPVEKKGLSCGCICPCCKQPLIARIGEHRRKHFAHKPESECNVEHAQQTALHILAKEIIQEEKLFAFPGYTIALSDVCRGMGNPLLNRLPKSLEYKKAYTAICNSVVLEKRISDFVPDIVVDVKGRTCLIEIAVTHFVDEVKQQKINAVGLPVVEVDLSAFLGQQITRDIIRDALVVQRENKKWLYNPLRKEAIDWAINEYKKLYEGIFESEKAAHERQALKKESQNKKREETEFLLRNLFEPGNYKRELQKLRSDDKVETILKQMSFYRYMDDSIPFFLDIPITGEMVFACDRRIWQATIFDKFVYCRKTHDVKTKRIEACLKEHTDYITINWKLSRFVNVEINGCRKAFMLFEDVINRYLYYLSYIGFISTVISGDASVECSQSLTPPNEEHAKRLQSAIESMDRFAPDADDQIARILKHKYIPNHTTDGAIQDRTIIEVPVELKEIEKRRNDEYEIGYLQVSEFDFDKSEPVRDRFNRRWLKCTDCGALKREDEMVSYGGQGNENQGVCRECKKHIPAI